MGIFDLLSRKKKHEQRDPLVSGRSVERTAATGDKDALIRATVQVAALCQVPVNERDTEWSAAFLCVAGRVAFRCGETQIVKGPDGFSYMQLHLPEPEKPYSAFIIGDNGMDFLLKQGVGAVIFAGTETPEWVFSYGDILGYHMSGEFIPPVPKNPDGTHLFRNMNLSDLETGNMPIAENTDAGECFRGHPSEQLLPKIARRHIGDFLRPYCEKPQVSLQSTGGLGHELIFTCEPAMFADEELFRWVLLGIGWFLPRGYAYTGVVLTDAKRYPQVFVAL